MYVKVMTLAVALAAISGCALLQPAPEVGEIPDNAAVLAITCNVRGAQVMLGDSLVGTVLKADKRQNFVVPAGEHTLTVKKFAYHDFSEKVAVVAGAVNTIDIALERVPTEVVEVPDLSGGKQ